DLSVHAYYNKLRGAMYRRSGKATETCQPEAAVTTSRGSLPAAGGPVRGGLRQASPAPGRTTARAPGRCRPGAARAGAGWAGRRSSAVGTRAVVGAWRPGRRP